MNHALSDVARLQPGDGALHVILKNSFFKDDILESSARIGMRIDYTYKIPVLVLKFQESYYDFLQIIKVTHPKKGDNWLDKNPVVVTLIISDTVITDVLSTFSFKLEKSESDQLRLQLDLLTRLSANVIKSLENEIDDYRSRENSNIVSFLFLGFNLIYFF